jgi:hypothetical protein
MQKDTFQNHVKTYVCIAKTYVLYKRKYVFAVRGHVFSLILRAGWFCALRMDAVIRDGCHPGSPDVKRRGMSATGTRNGEAPIYFIRWPDTI